jgi:hypothetical protein
MYARIKLNTVLHKNIFAVPSESIVSEDGKKYLFVMNDDSTVTRKEITDGVTVDAKTEITAGISEGDQIVISGMQVLEDGAAVHDIGGQ